MSAIIYFIILLTFYGAIECIGFRSDYTYHSNIDGWLKLHVIPVTWHDAQRLCFMEGAVLASPANENMQTALRLEANNLTTECKGIHTGVHSIFSKGYFYSMEGVPLTKMALQWLPGEPDNVDNTENCIAFVDGKVADIKCTAVLPFVCYKKITRYVSVMPCGTIDKAYEYIENSCYKFHSTQLTWFEAFEFCLAEGGYLAIINSVAEATILRELYRNHFPYGDESVTYIGFHDWYNNGVWTTIHGQELTEAGYAFWDTRELVDLEKTSTLKKFCGAMTHNAYLSVLWCDQAAKFLCEKDPDSLLHK